jgi:hypothetical protein
MVVYRSFNQLLRMSVGRISPQMDDQHDRIVNRVDPLFRSDVLGFEYALKVCFLLELPVEP